MSIRTRILLPTVLIILVVVAATLVSTIVLFSRFVEEAVRDRVVSASGVAARNLQFLKAEANIASLMLSENPVIVAAIAGNDRDALLRQARQLLRESGAEYCTFSDARGRVILRTHSPEYGDSVLSQANVRSALDGKRIALIETGNIIRLGVRAGAPVYDGEGTLLGVVSVGYRLDTDTVVDSIQEMLSCEVSIFLGDRRISTTVLGVDGARATGTLADPRVSATVLAGTSYTGNADVLGRAAVARYTPVVGPDNQVLGMLFVGFYLDESAKTIGAFVRSGMVITLIMLAAAVLILRVVINTVNRTVDDALRDAERANRAKSDFLASMSHEMRTPLNAVIGLSELTLGLSDLPEEVEANVEKIYSAGSSLLSTVNDILDISKIEVRKFEIIPGEYDVPSMLNDTITQNVIRIGSKPIRFILEIDENTPARLIGDELRVRYMINNLLSNAFKYTEEGSVTFTMRCEAAPDAAVRLTIRVADTGCGLRPEDRDRLFTDYMRFDPAANRKVEGAGLGLSIVKQLVEMMGGSITVESEYGKGSVFAIAFLQQRAGDAVMGVSVVENLKRFRYAMDKRRSKARLERVQLPQARVLVVDDNITNLDIARGLMKPYGMKVDCVTSGQKAVDVIHRGTPRYDAVFMDHMMPEMDGVEAARRIRNLGTEYGESVPIIALTANAIAGTETMFLQNGFQAFISKPIDIARLDEVIRNFVHTRQKKEEIPPAAPAQTDSRPQKRAPGIDALTCLSIACEERDPKKVDEAMLEIERYVYGAGDGLVDWLREQVEKREYDAIFNVIIHVNYCLTQ